MKIKSSISIPPQIQSESAMFTNSAAANILLRTQKEFLEFTHRESEFVVFDEKTQEFKEVHYEE